MLKHFFWIFAFLLIALLGDRLVGYIFARITQESLFRYSRLYSNKPDSADILFVGNSRGLTFYQPEVERITGKKTMNLSYNGMPADLAKNLVFDYLEHNPAPKLMVIDVTVCDRENDALKSSFNMYTPYSYRLDTLIRGIHVPDKWSGRKIVLGGSLSHLYRYNTELFQRVLYHRNKSDNDLLIDRVISDGAVNDTSFLSYQVRMFPNMVAHLKEMIDTAQAHGVKVQLVINPYYPPFAETVRDSFLSPLKNYVENATGLPVHNFSKALTQRDELGDYQHANKKGSIHYMNILMENGIFNPKSIAGNQEFEVGVPSNVAPQGNSIQPAVENYVGNSSITTRNLKSNTTLTDEAKPISLEVVKEKKTAPTSTLSGKKDFMAPLKHRRKEVEQSDSWISVDTAF